MDRLYSIGMDYFTVTFTGSAARKNARSQSMASLLACHLDEASIASFRASN